MTDEISEHKRLGHKFVIAMWIAVMIMVYFLFNNLLESDYNPNQNVRSQTSGEQNIVTLQRNRYGHYVSQGYCRRNSARVIGSLNQV